jgi:hypothetical protein
METKNLTRTLKALVTLAMIQSPLVPEAAAKGAKCEARAACDKAYAGAQTQMGVLSNQFGETSTGGQFGDSTALMGAAQGTATAACGVQQTCESLKAKCEQNKKSKQGCTDEDCSAVQETANKAAINCAQANSTATEAGKTQAATGGGGSGSQMMGMLAGAAMGALAAMAMQKKNKKDQLPPVDPNAAWNGVQLDCSKMDAFMYQACNAQMETKCAPQMDEATCLQFEARYCSGQGTGAMAPPVAAAMPPQVDPATGAIIGMPAMGQPGEGIGTQFCQNNIAYNFCKGAGRADCPSCLRLQQNASAICAQNPSACLASNSTVQMQKAAQTCPTDPAFANPAWAAGATAPAVTGGATSVGAGGPAVILMQSANGNIQTANSTSGPATNGNYGQGTLNGATPASASGALQEGRPTNFAGSNGVSGFSAGGSAFVPAGQGGSRELASSGTQFRPSSLGAPSSEVQAQYSQSLFVTSSQVIRNRCNTGRLNCP